MSDETPKCQEDVWEPPGYWHTHRCAKRARWLVKQPGDAYPKLMCGTHANVARRRQRFREGITVEPLQASS